MTEEQEPPKRRILAIRVASWYEWIVAYPDAATDGEIMCANGPSLLELDPAERLLKCDVINTGREIIRTIISDEDGKQRIADPNEKIPEDANTAQVKFFLHAYQATIATETDLDEMAAPMIVAKIPTLPVKSQIETANAIPEGLNREQRRSGGRRKL